MDIYDLTFEASERIALATNETANETANETQTENDDISFPDVKIDRS